MGPPTLQRNPGRQLRRPNESKLGESASKVAFERCVGKHRKRKAGLMEDGVFNVSGFSTMGKVMNESLKPGVLVAQMPQLAIVLKIS